MALANDSLEKVEEYKKTLDDKVAKLREELLKESASARRHGRPSRMSAKFTRRTFNLKRSLLNWRSRRQRG